MMLMSNTVLYKPASGVMVGMATFSVGSGSGGVGLHAKNANIANNNIAKLIKLYFFILVKFLQR